MGEARASASAQAGAWGDPCDRSRYAVVELFGLEVVAHPRIAPVFVRTVQEAHRALVCAGLQAYTPRRIDSYACRDIRHVAAADVSMHAFGLAWDVFRTPPGVPPPGGVWTPTDRLHPLWIAVFEHHGFAWGGRWRRRDEPHFEWNRPPPA